jgi:hypothetical protein
MDLNFIKKIMEKSGKNPPIKYADKSSGQPEPVILFNVLKKSFSEYEKGKYYVSTDKPGINELYYFF